MFVTAAFSFSGTELVGLAAAETENPRLALPKAVKQVFWRIALVSISGQFLCSMLTLPYSVLYGFLDYRRRSCPLQ